MSLIKLKELTTMLGKSISEKIDKDNPDEVNGKLMELSALQSTGSYALSLAGMVLNEKIAELISDNQFSGMSATDKKMIFNGRAKQEIFYKDLAEAQLKSIHYSIEAMRSILSFMKSEQQNLKYQTT
jgi:predicted thioredoxin/glutaredoxin